MPGSAVSVTGNSAAETGASVAAGSAIRWCWLVGKIFKATVFSPTTKTGSQSFPEERNGSAKPTRAVTMSVRKTKKFLVFIELPSSEASASVTQVFAAAQFPAGVISIAEYVYVHYVTNPD